MSLTKVNYVAEEAVISTQNLNNIQDSVIALQANAETGSTLTKVNYVDKETKISAKNLNDIQDAIIALENNSGGSSVNIQESKSVTITSNGTTTVTPDTGYDALGQVDVTVDVASGGGGTGFSVTFPATTTNWNPGGTGTTTAYLWISDGTNINMSDKNYSNVAGKTINNVIGLLVKSNYSGYVPKIALTGSVAVFGTSLPYGITTDSITPARLGMPQELIFLFLSDATISVIEIYNPD